MGMLTAEFPPTTGDALLAGYSVTKQPEETRRRIGYCPQFDAHFTNMTGREHVELYGAIKGIPKHLISDAANSKLAEVGLSEFDSDRLSSNYSGGMKRKLSVACATIGNPQVSFKFCESCTQVCFIKYTLLIALIDALEQDCLFG
jgi:ABC-type multidrug transport system, ATPase component